jgi:hypothetical protein
VLLKIRPMMQKLGTLGNVRMISWVTKTQGMVAVERMNPLVITQKRPLMIT